MFAEGQTQFHVINKMDFMKFELETISISFSSKLSYSNIQ